MSANGMPPNLLALFAPRAPIDYRKPLTRHPEARLSCLARYGDLFEDTSPPPVEPFEHPKDRKKRLEKEKLEAHLKVQKKLIEKRDCNDLKNPTKNPFATLFVGRISYETTDKKLRKEFEQYGPIKRIRMIADEDSKPRGYAFIEFDNERDMKEAYKSADGKKIDGRRVLVDVERGRTVEGWTPRRLGGGRGPARCALPKKAATPAPSIPPRAPPPARSFDRGANRSYGGRESYAPTSYGRDRDRGSGGGHHSESRRTFRTGANDIPVGAPRSRR